MASPEVFSHVGVLVCGLPVYRTTVRPQRPCTLAVVPGYVQLTCVWGSAVSVNLFPGG